MLETDKLELGKAIQLCQLMETMASDLTKLGKKSAIEEGVAAVSSQKVQGRPSVRATNREKKGITPGGSLYSGQTTEKPLVSSDGMGQKRVCSRCGSPHRP